MGPLQRISLTIDALVNLSIGLTLLLAPAGTLRVLGLPPGGAYFYTSVLGAVLFGIGLALLISLRAAAGLGLLGAIAINLCGSLAVAAWLIHNPGGISPSGEWLLWGVAALVFAVAVVELAARPWRNAP
jgi:hypothetical protein